LQVLDDGILTDSLGRKVDFRNTIIIMTSNIGSRQLKEFGQGVGFTTSAKAAQADTNAKSVVENALKRAFAPEFLNRIDDVIVFNSLQKEDIFKIIDIELKELFGRLLLMGYQIQLTDNAKEFIAEKGFDPNFGARPLNRAIQKYLEDPIAEEILKGELKEGDTLEVDFVKDAEEVAVKVIKAETAVITDKPAKPKRKKKEEDQDSSKN
jgi:ATP-dependent Clp protease ATP-binding subunit ClpC